MKRQQRLLHGLREQPPHIPLVMELHLALGRVDVDVHLGRVDLDEQAAERELPLHQRGVVALDEGTVEAAILDRPPVDKQMLVGAGRARHTRRADQAPGSHRRLAVPLHVDAGVVRDHLGHAIVAAGIDVQQADALAVQRRHALAHGGDVRYRSVIHPARRQLPHLALVAGEHKPHRRVGQRRQRQEMLNVAPLGLRRSEELAPRRQIVKQRAHLNRRAAGVAGRFHRADLSSVNVDARPLAGLVVARECRQRHAAHAGDAGNRLAAKTHRGDRGQVLRHLNLAGRVPLEAQQRVVTVHAGTVVGDTDEAAAAGLYVHGDACGPGVEGVLDQFLHHAGRALHHLASGDLVGDNFWQETDGTHVARPLYGQRLAAPSVFEMRLARSDSALGQAG